MRVIAGKYKGRTLTAPEGERVRPTSDRVREALFNVLAHGEFSRNNLPMDAQVLDMFAGAGTLGLEALSRGAARVVFIDDHAESRGAIRANVEHFGATGHTKIMRRNAADLGVMDANIKGPFDLVFLDPPYRKDLAGPALISAKAGGWLGGDALCVVEQAKSEPELSIEGFQELDCRTYGDTRVTFLKPIGPQT
jgi:16S rRNA (guanine966-N2)-methyltransferase